MKNLVQVIRLSRGVIQESWLFNSVELAEQKFLQEAAKIYNEPLPHDIRETSLDDGTFELNHQTVNLHWPNTFELK